MRSCYLDLIDVVDDEHVLQVLHRSLHPVVKGRCPLGVLKVKLIYRLQLLLCPLLARRYSYYRMYIKLNPKQTNLQMCRRSFVF